MDIRNLNVGDQYVGQDPDGNSVLMEITRNDFVDGYQLIESSKVVD